MLHGAFHITTGVPIAWMFQKTYVECTSFRKLTLHTNEHFIFCSRIVATIIYKVWTSSGTLDPLNYEIDISVPRTWTGYDILREVRSRLDIEVVALDLVPKQEQLLLTLPIYKVVPLTESTVKLNTIEVETQIAFNLARLAVKTGVDIKRKKNLEVRALRVALLTDVRSDAKIFVFRRLGFLSFVLSHLSDGVLVAGDLNFDGWRALQNLN